MAFWNTIQFLFLWKHTQIILTLLDLQMEVLELRTVRTTLVLGTTQEEYHQSFDANIWQVWLSTRLSDSCVSEDESRPQCPPADAVVPMAAVLPASCPPFSSPPPPPHHHKAGACSVVLSAASIVVDQRSLSRPWPHSVFVGSAALPVCGMDIMAPLSQAPYCSRRRPSGVFFICWNLFTSEPAIHAISSVEEADDDEDEEGWWWWCVC